MNTVLDYICIVKDSHATVVTKYFAKITTLRESFVASWLFWQRVNDVITIRILSIPIPHFQIAVL